MLSKNTIFAILLIFVPLSIAGSLLHWGGTVVFITACLAIIPLAAYMGEATEAIFVLGGHADRERFAAKLAKEYPDLPIWVSSGSPRRYVQKIFKKAGISPERLHLDYNARDTVTNFTSLADQLKAQGIDSVYLVTSDNHMRRARLVGEIIFGSRGIVIKPVTVPSQSPPEPLEKSLRDGFRAILWIITGSTGEFWLESDSSPPQFPTRSK